MSYFREQKGFSPLVIIILLLLVMLMGLIGWRVLSSTSSPEDSPATSESGSLESESGSADTEPTYASPPSESFRVDLPASWVKSTCDDTDNLLFLAPTEDKLGTCNSENGGSVALSKSEGDFTHPESFYSGNSSYSDVNYESFTLDGISGYKVTYTIAAEELTGYPPVGTKIIKYTAFDDSHTYNLVYTRMAGDDDESATVQAIAESFDKI